MRLVGGDAIRLEGSLTQAGAQQQLLRLSVGRCERRLAAVLPHRAAAQLDSLVAVQPQARGAQPLTSAEAVCTLVEGMRLPDWRRHARDGKAPAKSWPEHQVHTSSQVRVALAVLQRPHGGVCRDEGRRASRFNGEARAGQS